MNIGQGFEVATGGECPATIHQVVSPSNGRERYSVPFFQRVDLSVGAEDLRRLTKDANFDETNWMESTGETPFATGKYKWGESQLRTKIRSFTPVPTLTIEVTKMLEKSFTRNCMKSM